MSYTPEEKQDILNRVCELMEQGKSVKKALNNDNMPAESTFFKWLTENTDFSEQYARANESRADHIFEEIIDIADDQENDIYLNDEGIEVTNHNVIQRARLRVDARKWMLGKMQPKKYGEKLELDNKHSGELKIVRQVIS